MIRKLKNIRNLKSSIINSAVEDDLVTLKRVEIDLGSIEFRRVQNDLMWAAFLNSSEKCIEYLIYIGVDKPFKASHLLGACKINKIESVYETVKKFYKDVVIDKQSISDRLIQYHKIADNNSRLDIVHTLLSSGFITQDNVEKSIAKNIVSESNKKVVISILREIKLNNLGI